MNNHPNIKLEKVLKRLSEQIGQLENKSKILPETERKVS